MVRGGSGAIKVAQLARGLLGPISGIGRRDVLYAVEDEEAETSSSEVEDFEVCVWLPVRPRKS